MESDELKLDEEQLETIEKCASVFFKLSKIAALIGVDYQALRVAIKNPESKAFEFYNRGKLQSELTIKQQEMQLAKVGSPVAIELVSKSHYEMEDDE